MIDINELEIEITEVLLNKDEYENTVVRLVNWLLEIDQAANGAQDDLPSEVAA